MFIFNHLTNPFAVQGPFAQSVEKFLNRYYTQNSLLENFIKRI